LRDRLRGRTAPPPATSGPPLQIAAEQPIVHDVAATLPICVALDVAPGDQAMERLTGRVGRMPCRAAADSTSPEDHDLALSSRGRAVSVSSATNEGQLAPRHRVRH